MFEDDDSFKAYWIKAPLFFSFFKMRKNGVGWKEEDSRKGGNNGKHGVGGMGGERDVMKNI